ncbi:MAG TPA: glucose/sorbosone family PQQ-dependent dehydrogenase [Natronosporangium sp.]
MRRRICAALAAAVVAVAGGCFSSGEDGESSLEFAQRVVVTGLSDPWEITFGPDGLLWVTEKSSAEVTLVSVEDGTTQTALTIPDAVHHDGAQDGLLGLALHPDLAAGAPYVYLAYTYEDEAEQLRTKLVRYTYDPDARTLDEPVDLLTGLPASNDHNSGRLVFGPDGTLYYTIGDQGNNQFGRYCEPILAQRLPTREEVVNQDWTAYQGKVLRLNVDGSIPDGNPELDGVRSHVYTYGHRNAQGLVFGPGNQLYATEHGPKSDDELNLLLAGGNYGWPHVAGYADDQAYEYANWSAATGPACEDLAYSDYQVPAAVPRQPETAFAEPFVDPLATFHTVGNDHQFQDPDCPGPTSFLCWPTVAPSSLDYYRTGPIPGWPNSLLMPSLKEGTVYRLPLSADGSSVSEPEPLWRSANRYRDLAISPDGLRIYVATDSGGLVLDGSGVPTQTLEQPGAILEFAYQPGATAG